MVLFFSPPSKNIIKIPDKNDCFFFRHHLNIILKVQKARKLTEQKNFSKFVLFVQILVFCEKKSIMAQKILPKL